MSDRTAEREALLAQLQAYQSEGWDEYRNEVLGSRGPDCARDVDMIRLSQGEADDATRERLLIHFAVCPPCAGWYYAYERGSKEEWRDEKPTNVTNSLVASSSSRLMERLRAAQAPPTPRDLPGATARPAVPDQSDLTGINTKCERGDFEGGLKDLEPYLPGLLKTVGLSAKLAPQLLEFIRQTQPRRINVPEILRAFARQKLNLDRLPFLPTPKSLDSMVEESDISIWLARDEPGDPVEVCELRKEARQQNLKSPDELERLCERLGRRSDPVVASYINQLRKGVTQRQRRIRVVCSLPT